MNEIKIEKLDNTGRGICYINDKITFVKNALPGEIVNIKIIKETKKINEAIVTNYIKTSPLRIKPICPYFGICGGCDLQHIDYNETIKYKQEKLEGLLKKYANINYKPEIIPSINHLNYRNKITLKIKNKEFGYYEPSSHDLIKIKNCYLAEEAIYKFIPDIKKLDITNGELIIRNNYNNELLIWIKTKDKIKPDIEYLKSKHKIAGIILNNKTISGDNSFIEIINEQLFNVSYDSFFQINRYMCSKIFDLCLDNIEDNNCLLDLYCGVGTLGINASKKANKVFGIEIVKNAVLNAITNAKINKKEIYYMLGDVSTCLPKIKEKVDTIIVDPPRAGLDPKTKETIIKFNSKKIIYISCDPVTLCRDIKELNKYYNISMIKGLDMFPYTEHIETFCILERI